jgi:transcriptional antiterminator NusG
MCAEVDRVGYEADYRLLVPKRKLVETRQSETHEVLRTIFPGYVLVQSEEVRELAKLSRKCKGVFRFLENDGVFQEIRVEEIATLLHLTSNGGVIEVSKIETDEFGFVQIVSGSLKGLEGQIRKVDKYRRRAKVVFRLDGQEFVIFLGIEFNKKY